MLPICTVFKNFSLLLPQWFSSQSYNFGQEREEGKGDRQKGGEGGIKSLLPPMYNHNGL